MYVYVSYIYICIYLSLSLYLSLSIYTHIHRAPGARALPADTPTSGGATRGWHKRGWLNDNNNNNDNDNNINNELYCISPNGGGRIRQTNVLVRRRLTRHASTWLLHDCRPRARGTSTETVSISACANNTYNMIMYACSTDRRVYSIV